MKMEIAIMKTEIPENLDNENVRHRVESDWWTENGIDGIEEAPGGSVR